tara:strand:- start:84 stop:506 length:423 start_codon:yes stop_codon:yes gene_type:complete
MSEGLKALDRTAAARGGLLSGATLKGAQRYGQDLGSQEYQNAFNRYQTERTARLAPLQSLGGLAETSSANIGTAGQQYSTNVGNNLAAMGQARASGYEQNANLMREGLSQGASIFAKAYGARPSINDLQEYTPTSRRLGQ